MLKELLHEYETMAIEEEDPKRKELLEVLSGAVKVSYGV